LTGIAQANLPGANACWSWNAALSCNVVVYKVRGGEAPFLRQEEKLLLSFPRAADSILLKTACG
jgi:hypothetical protein